MTIFVCKKSKQIETKAHARCCFFFFIFTQIQSISVQRLGIKSYQIKWGSFPIFISFMTKKLFLMKLRPPLKTILRKIIIISDIFLRIRGTSILTKLYCTNGAQVVSWLFFFWTGFVLNKPNWSKFFQILLWMNVNHV